MSISQSLLPEFDQEMVNVRKTLERIPEDKFEYKPHERSFAMGRLAGHIAEMVGWAADTMATESFDIMPTSGPKPEAFNPKTSKELMEAFDKFRERARKALEAGTDADYMASWSLLAGGETVFTMPRIACIRSMILNHIIHHRGQLTVYMRLNDIPVPALYGPSADEGQMAATA